MGSPGEELWLDGESEWGESWMGSPGEVPDAAWEVREGFLEEGILELCRRDAWGQLGRSWVISLPSSFTSER